MAQRDSAWWTERIACLRRGAGSGRAAYDQARKDLDEAATDLARRSFGSLRKALGEEFEDGLREVLWGTESRQGLLQDLEGGQTVTSPVSYVRTSLLRGLVDVQRRFHPPQESASEGEAGYEPRLAREVAPTLLPRKVGEDFQDAAGFLAVALAIAHAAPESPVGQLVAREPGWSLKVVRGWKELAGFLRADVLRGTLRQRWRYDPKRQLKIPARDLWARAWQAAYYKHEEESAYTDAGEIPPSPEAGADAFYQHAQRFRDAFQAAVGTGLGIVRDGDGSRLPLEWLPARHPTLEDAKARQRRGSIEPR